MKKIFSIICLLGFVSLGANNLLAQDGPAILFPQKVHDFGTIIETDGSVTCTFEFINTGDQPLVINNVSTSCGCTSPGYTREPVPPKGKGEVKATFNPRNRVAPFDKSLTVVTNGRPERVTLRIKGTVVRKPVDLTETHPLTIGSLRLKSKKAEIGKISNDESKVVVMETANNEDSPISFSFENVPEYITIDAQPSTLQPKQQGLIKITYNANKKKNLGFTSDKVTVNVGGTKETIDVNAVLQENLANVYKNEDAKANAPRFITKTRNYNYGNVKKGKTVTASFDLTNEGKSDLIISNITSDKAGFKSNVKNEVKIKPGKSHTFKFNYTPVEIGDNTCMVYLNTNDLKDALVQLTIEGKVE